MLENSVQEKFSHSILDVVEGTMFEPNEWTVLFILIQNLIFFLMEQF